MKQSHRFCTKCGAAILDEDGGFCSKCGSPLVRAYSGRKTPTVTMPTNDYEELVEEKHKLKTTNYMAAVAVAVLGIFLIFFMLFLFQLAHQVACANNFWHIWFGAPC